jgi:uncharacterized protein YggU (UPF0235/DUF167 family)
VARLHLLVSPGAKRTDLERQPDGEFRAYVTARSTDGKANRALLILLAERFQVPKSLITITRGRASRHKVVDIAGIEYVDLLARLKV